MGSIPIGQRGFYLQFSTSRIIIQFLILFSFNNVIIFQKSFVFINSVLWVVLAKHGRYIFNIYKATNNKLPEPDAVYT